MYGILINAFISSNSKIDVTILAIQNLEVKKKFCWREMIVKPVMKVLEFRRHRIFDLNIAKCTVTALRLFLGIQGQGDWDCIFICATITLCQYILTHDSYLATDIAVPCQLIFRRLFSFLTSPHGLHYVECDRNGREVIIWNKTTVAYFKVQSRHSYEGTE
jgi:hypothetical protein